MKSPFLALALAGLASAAGAQTAPDSAGQTPAAAPAPSPICTDRPAKAEFACTVPQGRLQIESDLFNWSRLTSGGDRTDVFLVTNPTLKFGVGPSTDIEANIIPYELIDSRPAGGPTASVGGVGDLYLKLKQRLTDPAGKAQFALVPYVKIPTARRELGNREWEGGVIGAFNYSLPHGITLTLAPEVDVLANSAMPSHRHAQFVGAANLGFAIDPKLTLYTELWTAQNFDPAGTTRQYSADTALAYVVTPDLQVDVGGNVGLNRLTPDAQLYVGISTRF